LLTSSRSDAGQRHYSDAVVERVSLIRQLFDAGLSSRVIARRCCGLGGLML
jgi:DNA-binding transcriptional MerR regulator